MTIVGTRPELIKMCRVIERFDEHTEHVLVHTGQNYDYELTRSSSTTSASASPTAFSKPPAPTPRPRSLG